MEWLGGIADLVLHLDHHLVQLLSQYGVWIYAILFLIVFAETGLVVTPFLPGDSLLFGAGALAAVDNSHTLSIGRLWLLLSVAAILGNTANFAIGRALGQRVPAAGLRYLSAQHLARTREFFARHGGMAIVLSRFVPIVRTFAPFVAGLGRMGGWRFQAYNFTGGLAWVSLLTLTGFAFGNLPLVKQNFAMVSLAIIALSLLPLVWVAWRERRSHG